MIEPGVQLLGNTRIGARCEIGAGSILRDTRVDDDAVVARNRFSIPAAWPKARHWARSRGCVQAPTFARARMWAASWN